MKNIYQIVISGFAVFSLASCTMFSSDSKSLAIKGNFSVRMNVTAKHYQSTDQYPVSSKMLNDTPLFNQVIPVDSGLIGVYRNNGFSCTILWTGIIPLNSAPITNLNGLATSKCPARGTINESDVISAKWN